MFEELISNMKAAKAAKEHAPDLLIHEYQAPSTQNLNRGDRDPGTNAMTATNLEIKLLEFGFDGKVTGIKHGPLITRYEIRLANGTRISKVKSVADDLAIALMANNIRIQAPIPGTSLIGIEVANEKFATVGIKQVIDAARKAPGELPIGVGVDTMGIPKVVDLAKMPHLLIAGATGSGKSVGLNGIILSLLYTKSPEECKLILIDPKRVEMAAYANIPHLLTPVVQTPSRAFIVLRQLITIMETRYKMLEIAKVRNIAAYNERGLPNMPYIVTIIDEMADLMMTSGKETETNIIRLAQMARAVGIHLILATQKPIVKVITGLIKSNIPARMAYQVASGVDSRVILDCNGAENLIGRGDMLMQYPGIAEPERFHSAWVSDSDINTVCNFFQ